MMWHESVGIIRYGPGKRLVVEVDQGIADFYRAMIPKWIRTSPQRYAAHISVVRKEQKEPDMSVWGLHEGEAVSFEYTNEIRNCPRYYWLDVRCPKLGEIRRELGLTDKPWWENLFHITVANVKENGV